jgi:hypothetical protein
MKEVSSTEHSYSKKQVVTLSINQDRMAFWDKHETHLKQSFAVQNGMCGHCTAVDKIVFSMSSKLRETDL